MPLLPPRAALWVTGAVLFGGGVWYTMGGAKGQEYFAGYLLEQSLSIDNLFVFVLVFNYFKTPPDAQKKVLSWGIYSAAGEESRERSLPLSCSCYTHAWLAVGPSGTSRFPAWRSTRITFRVAAALILSPGSPQRYGW